MKGSRAFLMALVLTGLVFVAPASCIFSPQEDGETPADRENNEHHNVPEEEAVICHSSEEVFTKILMEDTNCVLVATPVSSEDEPVICYQYQLHGKNDELIKEGYLRLANPRLEEERQVETGALEAGFIVYVYLTVWDYPNYNYTRPWTRYRSSQPTLGSWNNRITSCCPRHTIWMLYDGANYTGRFIYCSRPISDLRIYRFDNTASSLRAGFRYNPLLPNDLRPINDPRTIK